nr:RNA-directed DNA polymerase (reverse transcriptase) and Integrase domain containing protein [Haemonchus contortus]
MGRPMLRPPRITLKSANDKPINVRGCYEGNFVIDGHLRRDGTTAYLDDILVTGRTIDEHNTQLDAVLQRIQDYGFRVRLEKCKFLQTEINYLDFVINEQGRRPDPGKIKATQKMSAPKDVSQLRAFLGLINFYGNFVKDLHNLRAPLDALTNKDVVYTWTPECQSSFDKIKAILSSDLLLTYFDPNLPIIVAADASNYGIGATLSHRFPDGSEKVVYHVSRCLTTAQKNYSQIEKEALALIFAVQKFHRSVHGRHFTLKTDHKPLVAIFRSKKGISVYSANRLQRWATMLLNYNFAIEYVNTKDFGQVDALLTSHNAAPINAGGLRCRQHVIDIFYIYYPSVERHFRKVREPYDSCHGQRDAVYIFAVPLFCRSRGITHIRTPPFHPQSNEQAERFVNTFKRGLDKLKGEEPTLDALQTFLMAYCSTPCPSVPDQRSPAEAFLGRRLRIDLDLMLPQEDVADGQRDVKMETQFNRRHGALRRKFERNNTVYAKDYRGTKFDVLETQHTSYAAEIYYGADT